MYIYISTKRDTLDKSIEEELEYGRTADSKFRTNHKFDFKKSY